MSAVGQPPSFPLEGCDLALVSRSEIVEAIKIAPETSSFFGGPSLARITSSAVVKYGRHVHLHEARNMRYVSQNTNIRLPAVIDEWEAEDAPSCDESNTSYIVMQYIDGRMVSDIWDGLNIESRRSILNQLSEYIQELHTLKMDCPGPVGGGISEGSFFTDYGAGPFESQQHMEDWFNTRLQVCHDFNRAIQTPSGWFTGRFNSLVMCHLDIHARNLILDNHGKLWLLDWEFSGAYPSYFEIANLRWRGPGQLADELADMMQNQYQNQQEEIGKLHAIAFALTTGAYCQPKGSSPTPESE